VRGVVRRARVVDRGVGSVGEALEQRAVVVRQALGLRESGPVVPAVEVRADGVRVELVAVVERDAVLQRERVGETVFGLLPALGEQRGGVGRARLDADEALEDLARDAERLAVARERGVEPARVVRRAEDERAVDVRRFLVRAAAVALAGASAEHDRAQGDDRGAGHPALSRIVEHLLCTFHDNADDERAGFTPASSARV
jgi:hypothetical protein